MPLGEGVADLAGTADQHVVEVEGALVGGGVDGLGGQVLLGAGWNTACSRLSSAVEADRPASSGRKPT